jgi:hypothetical protein
MLGDGTSTPYKRVIRYLSPSLPQAGIVVPQFRCKNLRVPRPPAPSARTCFPPWPVAELSAARARGNRRLACGCGGLVEVCGRGA